MIRSLFKATGVTVKSVMCYRGESGSLEFRASPTSSHGPEGLEGINVLAGALKKRITESLRLPRALIREVADEAGVRDPKLLRKFLTREQKAQRSSMWSCSRVLVPSWAARYLPIRMSAGKVWCSSLSAIASTHLTYSGSFAVSS